MSKYSQFFAILKKTDLTKEEIVLWFTDGKTDSLSSLSVKQYNELLSKLQKFNGVPPGDKMRKKMISLAKSMQWATNTTQIISKLDEWLLKQKFKKKLMALTEAELNTMVTIFETKVYPDYLKGLNK